MGNCSNSDHKNITSNPMATIPEIVGNKSSVKVRFADVYQVGAVLGQGSYSVVRCATRIADKMQVAVKILSKSRLQREDEINLKREVQILKSLDHPNIVKVLDFFDEDKYFYVVLEYLSGGELFDRLMEKAVYTEGEARDLAVILLNAIKYCHDRDIVHRDIKPENILLVSKGSDTNLKLADFGFAVQSAGAPSIKQQAGTPGYISPEVISGKVHGNPVDMWSMGVILYMLLGGYPPFYEPEDDQKTMFRKILAADFQFHADTWDPVSAEAKDMIRGLLTVDADKRLTVDQCLAHPWVFKPRTELVVRDLNRNMVVLRNFRAARILQTAAAGANVAIDVIRHLSGANLGKGYTVNDAAIDVMRKISGASLTDSVNAARKRSTTNVYKSNSPSVDTSGSRKSTSSPSRFPADAEK